MTDELTYEREISDALTDAPQASREFFENATRKLTRSDLNGTYSERYLYGLDCHKQLARTPLVPEFVDLMIGERAEEREAFKAYLRSGIASELNRRQRTRYRLGFFFTLDGLADLFDMVLEDEEDVFVYAYAPLLRALDARTGKLEQSVLDLAPKSLALYRAYISEDTSAQMYEGWANDSVRAIRRAVETWGSSPNG